MKTSSPVAPHPAHAPRLAPRPPGATGWGLRCRPVMATRSCRAALWAAHDGATPRASRPRPFESLLASEPPVALSVRVPRSTHVPRRRRLLPRFPGSARSALTTPQAPSVLRCPWAGAFWPWVSLASLFAAPPSRPRPVSWALTVLVLALPPRFPGALPLVAS